MLSFLKTHPSQDAKVAQAVQATVKERESKIDYAKTIQEIHTAFATESQNLVEQAKDVLANPTVSDQDRNKVDLAMKFGFGRSNQIQDIRHRYAEVKSQEKMLNAVLESIEFISSNNWIPLSSVERICKKYNLVFGHVRKYVGFVPLDNLKEIEEFDMKYRERLQSKNINANDITEEMLERHFWASRSHLPFDMVDIKRNKNLRGIIREEILVDLSKNPMDSLRICAPVKDMDMRNMEVVDGFLVQEVRNIPDPIVLVEKSFSGISGYYIVTAWGDESNDEEVRGYKNA